MILNPSHEITQSGLPDHILDSYVRYKKGSRAIVAWMAQYGPQRFKGRKQLPIKQMIVLGRILCEKVKDVGRLPSEVDFHFREVISAREHLSRYFRQNVDKCKEDEADTVNHEHFTQSLAAIHQELRKAAGINQPRTTQMIRRSDSAASEVHNLYERLSLEVTHSDDINDYNDNDDSDVQSSTATSNCSCCVDQPEKYDSVLPTVATGDAEDFDTMNSSIEVILILEQICQILDTVQSYWTKAGAGKMTVVATTCLTNVAWAALRDLGCQLQDQSIASLTISEIRKTVLGFDTSTGTAIHTLLTALETSWNILQSPSDASQIASGLIQNPTDYLPTSKDEASVRSAAMQRMLQKNMVELVQRRKIPDIVWSGSPGLVVTAANTTHDSSLFSRSLLHHLSASIYVAYVQSLKQASLVSVPRIAALRLAQEAMSSLDHFLDNKVIFPCRCTQTLAYRLVNLRSELEAFLKLKNWNLYFQSPFICGNHILEILDLCSYYGMHLFHYRHYIASVVHVYNMLHQLAGLEKIPILEHLCQMFSPILFPSGARPIANFTSSWCRYTGARLDFRTRGRSQNHRDTWCMKIPAHAAARAAGLNAHTSKDEATDPKFDYGCIDLVMNMKKREWMLDTHGSHSMRSGGGVQSKMTQEHRQCPMTNCRVALTSMENLVHPINTAFGTFEDPHGSSHLPTARVNLFSVFNTCVNIVSEISDHTHVQPQEKGQYCICFVQSILTAADRIVDGRKLGRVECWKKAERQTIEVVKIQLFNAVKKIGDKPQTSSWLWDLC